MLSTLSTQLARVKRKKEALLSCRFTHLDIAVAAVRAAEHAKRPLLLTLDARGGLTHSLEYLIIASLDLGRSASVPVAWEILIEPVRTVFELAVQEGAVSITPDSTGVEPQKYDNFITWATSHAAAHGVEVVYHAASAYPAASLRQLADRHTVQAIRTSITHTEKGQVVAPPHMVADAAQHARLPLIAEEAELKGAQIKRLFKAGVSAFTLGEQLEEAYTAGLRTGLRNRGESQPARYMAPAMIAVEQAVTSYLTYLES